MNQLYPNTHEILGADVADDEIPDFALLVLRL